MTLPPLPLGPWLERPLCVEGIWTAGTQHRFGLGVVLLLEQDDAVLLIRKAPKSGYEFSGLLALPGGMVRGKQGDSLAQAVHSSLASRLQAEAGVSLDALQLLPSLVSVPPPISSYTAKGRRRFTAVLGLRAEARGEIRPVAGDRSVDRAELWRPPLPWRQLAPANCLLLATQRWPRLDPAERSLAREPVRRSLERCQGWARQLDLPAPAPPWG
jgi:ADP-ribose pyrophosphatase YjhB (NUDIX family)